MNPTNDEQPQGGLGGLASERNQTSDIAVVRRAIRDDWPISPAMRQLIANQMALIVGRGESDTRSKVAAARVLVAADSVNAKREAMDINAERGISQTNVSVNVGVGVKVVEDENWYGNRSHHHAAEGAAASGSHSAVAGTLQSGGVRKTLGQNGHGSNGDH